MLIRITSASLLKIYTSDSVSACIEVKYPFMSDKATEFICTAIRLLEFHHKDSITTDDIFTEIAGNEELAVQYARELNNAGLFYTEKYKPQYVCLVRDDFLRVAGKDSGIVFNAFARRVSDHISRVRRPVEPGEIAYICSLRDELSLSDGIAFEIIKEFIAMDSRLTAYDIASLLDPKAQWNSISTVQANIDAFKPAYMFVKKLMMSLGYKEKPSFKELSYYSKWVNEWGFSNTDIMSIAATQVNGDYAIEYLDGTLRNIRQQGDVKNVKKSLDESETLKRMLSILGIRRKIIGKHVTIYSEMRKQWDKDTLLFAAECASMAGKKKGQWYQVQKKLDEWQANSSLKTLDDIKTYELKKEGSLPF